ncbi:endonuclease/exonuclease/phosphatase family protein [Sansalvadorimonas sp. 2012CJ34-2]|uniref:Endonuclease/exonuclease/phosphatase family protein n=1 Tax=Parendozoicomonas callyspongiae TaxID=2942213 RepID=A0ABT0PL42_9GAMM|nr:endonuclease/exonuclease/phosphatase family protein [Sansalvadorimonas sp. 2012CJ34-2]MCL6272112.1 endonuclease/exonuclease/phosphatase family protein [Sansalvadorimonas sp. 2012CJ34-2]
MRLESEVPQKSYGLVTRWLILAALLTIAPLTLGQNARNTDSIRLATWNLEWLRPEFRPNSDLRRSEQDYQALRKEFIRLNPDILAIQEVASEEIMAKIAPSDQFQTILEYRDSEQRAGFTVRKNIPWKRHSDVPLDLGHDGLRNGVHISLMSNGHPLHLLSVHLPSGCHDGSLAQEKTGCLRLKRLVSPIRDWLLTYSRNGASAIILGDLNRRLKTEGEFWKAISQGYEITSPTLNKNSFCAREIHNRHKSRLLIDHIIIAGTFRSPPASEHVWSEAVGKNSLLSDHCPVYIDFSLN